MALTCGHLKIEDLTPGRVSQWTSGPLGFAGWYKPSQPTHSHLIREIIPPMLEPHIRQIMLECSPELQVVEVNVPPGFRSEDGWKTCIRETAAGTHIEALTRDDRAIAKEIGKAMIDDKDYKHYWWTVDDWNVEYEDNFKLEIDFHESNEETYVLVPNSGTFDVDLGDCSPKYDLRGLEYRKEPLPDEVIAAMAEVDKKKDEADEEIMKEMARFESETRLHLLRTTPPEDRIIPFSEQVDCQYQGWIRNISVNYYSCPAMNTRSNLETLYLSESIRCKAEIIRKPQNGRGYALAVCDYGLLHISTMHLCRVPKIGETILATISPIDVGVKKPFPLTTEYIH